MTSNTEKLLDNIGWKLLVLLQQDARCSFSELGREVGLSPPAVAERVRRMEEAGIITGYHADVNVEKLGMSIQAFVRLSAVGDQGERVNALVRDLPEVLECYRVTGNDSYILKVIAVSIGHLEALIDRLVPLGEVTTSLILSSPIVWRAIQRPG